MKKVIIGLIVLVLLTSLVMARTPDSAMQQPGNGGSNGPSLVDPDVDTPVDWPVEPIAPVVRNSGGGHKDVIECQEGELCTVIVCDDRIEANKDDIRYMFTIRHSYKFESKVISVCSNKEIGILSFVETLLIEPNENGCYEVIV